MQDLAEELDVAVAEGRRGTHTAAVASAVESVGCTGGYLKIEVMLKWFLLSTC